MAIAPSSAGCRSRPRATILTWIFRSTATILVSSQPAARHPACSGPRKYKARLTSSGISFGKARIAVAAMATPAHPRAWPAALHVRMPLPLIYSTEQTVEAMKADPNFHYVASVIVRSVEEAPDGVTIHAGSRSSSVSGLPPAESTAPPPSCCVRCIASISRSAFTTRSIFCSPRCAAWRRQRHRGASAYSGPAFPRDADNAISPHTIHLQAYTYNDLFRAPSSKSWGRCGRFSP